MSRTRTWLGYPVREWAIALVAGVIVFAGLHWGGAWLWIAVALGWLTVWIACKCLAFLGALLGGRI